MCGRTGEGKYAVWGQRIWAELRSSGYPLNANHWESYREFLARHDRVDDWLESIKPSPRLTTENDPKLTEQGTKRALQVAMQHMSLNSRHIVRMWIRDQGSQWHKQRWRAALPMDDFTKPSRYEQ